MPYKVKLEKQKIQLQMTNIKLIKKIFIVLILAVLAGCFKVDADIKRADRLVKTSSESYEKAQDLYKKALTDLKPGKKRQGVLLKLAKLYFNRGLFEEASRLLENSDLKEGRRLLAIALFKQSDFTGALEVFEKNNEDNDPEYLYYYGLVLEESNLYDKAQRIYLNIKGPSKYKDKAEKRINAINLVSGSEPFSGVDEEVKNLILSSPSQKDYPEASGIYLLVDEKVRLEENNSMINEDHYVVKVLNDRGKEKFGEIIIGYDSTYEKIELEYARTIKSDGTVVTVGDKNIRDVSIYLNYPLYSNARARIISMPELAVGSVIEYKVKIIKNQLPNKKDFNTPYWLQADEPIVLQRCVINIPENRMLNYKVINGEYNTFGFDLNPREKNENGRRIYSVEFKNVPQIIPEPSMPPLSRSDAYILFYTFKDWQDIFDWWSSLYRGKIIADAQIKAKVEDLIKDKLSDEEKARAIYNFCAQDIRYVAVEYGDAGYEPHMASEIFGNKYGDCKDKAMLLISMLGAAGIEAYPVLISTYDNFNTQADVPSLLFNHAIAAVNLGGKLIFMDATANTVPFTELPYDDQDRLVMVFFKDKYELIKTPLFKPEHNKVDTEMKIIINKDESIEATRSIHTWGAYDYAQRYWLKFTMPVLIEEGLKQRVRSFADQAVLTGHKFYNVEDLNKNVILEYSFKAPQYLKKAGQVRIMDQLGGIDTSSLIKDVRRYPIEFSGLGLRTQSTEVVLPQQLKVKYLPPQMKVDNKWFSFLSRYELKGRNILRFYLSYEQKVKSVSVEDYSEYKKAIEGMAELANQQVILQETGR